MLHYNDPAEYAGKIIIKFIKRWPDKEMAGCSLNLPKCVMTTNHASRSVGGFLQNDKNGRGPRRYSLLESFLQKKWLNAAREMKI